MPWKINFDCWLNTTTNINNINNPYLKLFPKIISGSPPAPSPLPPPPPSPNTRQGDCPSLASCKKL